MDPLMHTEPEREASLFPGRCAGNRSSRGFVTTPGAIVDWMVERLFRDRPPTARQKLLDPGCGTGAFIAGVLRWCRRRGLKPPQITGVEVDSRHIPILQEQFRSARAVRILEGDFLGSGAEQYDFIVGNPPYVAIGQLSETERNHYREQFAAARGRFDLYLLFFEQAVKQLRLGGRMVFITPEKYLYVESAAPVRRMLAGQNVEEIRLVREDTFGDLVTYPTITVVTRGAPGRTRMIDRDGEELLADLPTDGRSWLPTITGSVGSKGGPVLADICSRISCGIATGADGVFVRLTATLVDGIRRFAHPTISGRELSPDSAALHSRFSMLIPYTNQGELLALEELGPLEDYLKQPILQARLRRRYCVSRKPWYAFHETPNLAEILRPKILCKDIGERPQFWMDREGRIVPRHSVYYIVPRVPELLKPTLEYLQSMTAQKWLRQNCQRAAKGFLRLQSRNLQRLPIPDSLALSLVSPVPRSDRDGAVAALSAG